MAWTLINMFAGGFKSFPKEFIYKKWQYKAKPRKMAKRKQNVAKEITEINKTIAAYPNQ